MRHGSLGTTLISPKARRRADRCGTEGRRSKRRETREFGHSYSFIWSWNPAADGRIGELQNVSNEKTTWSRNHLGAPQRRNIPSCPKFQRHLEPRPLKRLKWASILRQQYRRHISPHMQTTTGFHHNTPNRHCTPRTHLFPSLLLPMQTRQLMAFQPARQWGEMGKRRAEKRYSSSLF